jgi:hypothetical protein
MFTFLLEEAHESMSGGREEKMRVSKRVEKP